MAPPWFHFFLFLGVRTSEAGLNEHTWKATDTKTAPGPKTPRCVPAALPLAEAWHRSGAVCGCPNSLLSTVHHDSVLQRSHPRHSTKPEWQSHSPPVPQHMEQVFCSLQTPTEEADISVWRNETCKFQSSFLHPSAPCISRNSRSMLISSQSGFAEH